MNENTLNRRLFKMTAVIVIVSIILLLCGGFILGYIYNGLRDSTIERLKSEVDKNREMICNVVDNDMQTMRLLAAFYEYNEDLNTQYFVDKVEEYRVKTPFYFLMYMGLDGKGEVTNFDTKKNMEVTIDTIKPQAKDAVLRSRRGEEVVTTVYNSNVTGLKVYAYAVPVKVNGQIAGTLLAGLKIESIGKLLDEDKILGDRGYIHLLDSSGTYLYRSPKTVVKEILENFFDGPYITFQNRDATLKSMKKGEDVVSTFTYEDKKYNFLLEPVGIGDWQMLCVNTTKQLNGVTYNLAITMGIAVVLFFLVALIIMIFGYRILKESNRELDYLIHKDPLTGADNLQSFETQLGKCLETSKHYTVVAVNLVHFKFINGIYGKDIADELLKNIYNILREHLKDGEFCCRDTADLFYICLSDIDEAVIEIRVSAMMGRIAEDFKKFHKYRLRSYCGAVIVEEQNEEECNADDILFHVAIALAKAKNDHRNSISFFDKKLSEEEQMENFVESHMHQALADGEFKMYLQPKINLHQKGESVVSGAEALVRWKRSDGNMIYPDQFIPLFEKNGFCILLDMYMVECACKQIRQWIDEGKTPIPISVNQSKQVFYQGGYLKKLKKLIKKYDIPAELITLELLERVAAENIEELNERIQELKAVGFKISMDDFGSGYSTLNILGRLNLDELKLDRAFLLNLSKDNKRPELVMKQIVQMAKQLRLETVVEGVETLENEELVKSFGCDFGQGYYYSKPIDTDEFNAKYMH